MISPPTHDVRNFANVNSPSFFDFRHNPLVLKVLLLPNYESIAKISALGTGLIVVIFLFIGSYGLHQNGMEGFYSISWEEAWPENFAAFSNWFGVAVCKFRNFWKCTCILYYEHTTHPSLSWIRPCTFHVFN